MTQQEEIRQGIEEILLSVYGTMAHQGKVSSQEMLATKYIIDYLHSQEVARRNPREPLTMKELIMYETLEPLI